MTASKICSKCGEEKPVEAFSINNRRTDGLEGFCRLCRKETRKEWVPSNPEKLKELGAKWRAENQGKIKAGKERLKAEKREATAAKRVKRDAERAERSEEIAREKRERRSKYKKANREKINEAVRR